MASPNKIHLSVKDTGIVHFNPPTEDSASKVSELLQENHEKHHIFFNKIGFHNHIVHHLLSLYGLGAPAPVLEEQFKRNASYQRPQFPMQETVVQDMTNNPEHFAKYLGQEEYYHSYLVFWQNEMEKKGWENVLNEYVFAGTVQADDLLTGLFSGLLHPLIHLGFGIEFHQPAIIAEALAQACVKSNWIGVYLRTIEKAAVPTSKTLLGLLDDIKADPKLHAAVDWLEENKIRDGVLKNAPDEMIHYAKQWTVSPGELEKKTAEMISADAYFAATAQHPPKQVKFDFSFMHCVTSSIFFPTFNAQTWLSDTCKRRLLQFKGYMDLIMYVAGGCPPLLPEELSNYVPVKQATGETGWKDIFTRLFQFPDDGHAVKLARALANAEQISKAYEAEEWAMLKGPLWETIGNIAVDSVEDAGRNWLRGAGFEEAWAGFEDRPRPSRL